MKHALPFRALIALSLIALLAASASPRARAQGRAPYELNGIFAVTGPAAFIGAPASQAFKAIEGYVNSTGGINGRPIRMIVLDDQTNPQVAVQLVNGLAAKNVAVFIGPMATASCNAVLGPVAHGPVAYCVSPFISPPSGSYLFVQGGSPIDGGVVSLRYLKERGLRRVAMLNSTDATGQALDRASEEAFTYPEFRSMQLVSHLHFSPQDVSVAAQIVQIKAANPQALVSWNLGTGFGTVARGLHDAGLDALPLITAGGNASAGQIKRLADFMPTDMHFLVSPLWAEDSRVPKAVKDQQAIFRRVMQAAGLPNDGAYASDWDITMIEIDALRHLPPDPTAEQVRNYISHINHHVGANGIFDFRFGSQSGAGQTIFILVHWDPRTNRFVSSSTPGGHPLPS
ncbi:MAG TPA: ABC transporter substrate-binding protein [Candidatus Binatia bacterium]|nr:ABC transporter substrate-binding protein [Candidatus Binatia bacterium]